MLPNEKKSWISGLIIALCLGLVGCVVSVTQEEIAHAHFGPPPRGYEKIIRSLVHDRISNPDSAKYRYLPPSKGYALVDDQKRFGWIVKAYINVKNNSGSYFGERPYYFLFADGKSRDVSDLYYLGRAKFIEPPKE